MRPDHETRGGRARTYLAWLVAVLVTVVGASVFYVVLVFGGR